MSEQLPDTINPDADKYEHLGREFADNVGRSDGPNVAKSLHAHFEQDVRDWFYDQVWPYFSRIPEEQWSRSESMTAEIYCRNAVSFFQSVRGRTVATERGYIPIEKAEWYTNWLLRLNLGESAAKQAMEGWLPEFNERDSDDQLQLFSAAMSKCLPEIQGQFFLVHLYSGLDPMERPGSILRYRQRRPTHRPAPRLPLLRPASGHARFGTGVQPEVKRASPRPSPILTLEGRNPETVVRRRNCRKSTRQ